MRVEVAGDAGAGFAGAGTVVSLNNAGVPVSTSCVSTCPSASLWRTCQVTAAPEPAQVHHGRTRTGQACVPYCMDPDVGQFRLMHRGLLNFKCMITHCSFKSGGGGTAIGILVQYCVIDADAEVMFIV